MSDPFLRLPEVIRETGRSRSRIYADMEAGKFPDSIKIGPNAVAWPKSAIDQWKEDRKNAAH